MVNETDPFEGRAKLMRVLLINDAASPHTGGMNRVVVDTCACLAVHGHEVALAYHDDHAVSVKCPTFHVPDRWPIRQRVQELKRAIDTFKPDVIQSHSSKILPVVAEMVQQRPTCVFLHDHSWFCSGVDRMTREGIPCHRPHGIGCLAAHYTQGCGVKNPLVNLERWRWIQERIRIRELPRVRFQVASEFTKQGLLENGFPEGRIDVIPLFSQPPLLQEAVVPGQMLVASRLEPSKGVGLAIEAAAKLVDVPWKLAIAGEGPQRGELEALARPLGVGRHVEFLGELTPDQLSPWYERAQFVLFPVLRPEPFGLVGVEALAHGRPVVAFPGGAVEEWLRPGETGVLVETRTAQALSEAMGSMLNNPARCRLMGVSARVQYGNFRPEAYVDRLVKAFGRAREDFAAEKVA